MNKPYDNMENTLREYLDASMEKLLPEDLTERYYILERLNSANGCDTLLVSDKKENTKYVAKCYSKTNPLYESTESEQIKNIENRAVPFFAGEYCNEEYRCVLREYVEGISLDAYMKLGRVTEKEIVDIAIKLVKEMKVLHDSRPSIIHRDIKPQNIIIKEDKSVALIDFGISRIYKENENEDTVFGGTRFFAPPEQYGFMQTDIRSDIYSFGIALSWMITGTARPIQKPHTRLEEIACKCCEFAPDRRFKNDDALLTQLIKLTPEYQKENEQRRKKLRIAVFVFAGCIAAGCFLYMALMREGLAGSRTVQFKEPLIEQAVRFTLDKPSGVITKENLESIEGIYILGSSIYASLDEFYNGKDEWFRNGMISGGIQEISDLEEMPNLREVFIGGQDVKDISPLKTLENLEQVEFFNNEIEDISPLKNKQKLFKTGFSFNKLKSIEPLTTCPRISSIDLRSAGTFDRKPIESLNGLDLLDITCDSDAYKYLDGKYITMLKLGAPGQTDLACIKEASEIKSLYIDWSEITDITALEGRADITYLNMTGCVLEDISPIFSMPALEKVEISAKMKDKFDAYVDDNGIDYKFEAIFTN